MITKQEREFSVIRHILSYCNLVSERLKQYSMSYEEFIVNVDHRDLISMPIMQIGELVNHLSEEFKEAHKDIPWHIIRGMRNWFAHNYYEMNYKKIWDTAVDDIPALREFCEGVLESQ